MTYSMCLIQPVGVFFFVHMTLLRLSKNEEKKDVCLSLHDVSHHCRNKVDIGFVTVRVGSVLWAKIGETESALCFLFNCIENMAIKKTKDINEDG